MYAWLNYYVTYCLSSDPDADDIRTVKTSNRSPSSEHHDAHFLRPLQSGALPSHPRYRSSLIRAGIDIPGQCISQDAEGATLLSCQRYQLYSKTFPHLHTDRVSIYRLWRGVSYIHWYPSQLASPTWWSWSLLKYPLRYGGASSAGFYCPSSDGYR